METPPPTGNAYAGLVRSAAGSSRSSPSCVPPAAGLVPGSDLDLRGICLLTARHDIRAAGCERAPGGPFIDRRRVALDRIETLHPEADVRYGVEQRFRVRMRGGVEQLPGRGGFD